MKNATIPFSFTFLKINRLAKLMCLAAGFLLLTGCEDDEEKGLITQPHDQNKMMQIMHDMMEQMEENPMTGDPDLVFANMMILHHQGAIDMSNEELQSGDDTAIKAIAQMILTDQQKEIQELQAFKSSYQPDQGNDAEFHMELMAAMEKSGQAADLRVLTGDTDHDFAELMIVHHQSAIENARSVMEHGTSPEIKQMAHMMVNAQMGEIKQLQEWLLAHKQY